MNQEICRQCGDVECAGLTALSGRGVAVREAKSIESGVKPPYSIGARGRGAFSVARSRTGHQVNVHGFLLKTTDRRRRCFQRIQERQRMERRMGPALLYWSSSAPQDWTDVSSSVPHEWETQIQNSHSQSFPIRGGYPISRRFEAKLPWQSQSGSRSTRPDSLASCVFQMCSSFFIRCLS